MTPCEFRNYIFKRRFRIYTYHAENHGVSPERPLVCCHTLFSSIAVCDHPNMIYLSNPFAVMHLANITSIECDELSRSPLTLIKIQCGDNGTVYTFEAS